MINNINNFLKTIGGYYAICNLPDYPNNNCYYLYVDGVKNLDALMEYLETITFILRRMMN